MHAPAADDPGLADALNAAVWSHVWSPYKVTKACMSFTIIEQLHGQLVTSSMAGRMMLKRTGKYVG